MIPCNFKTVDISEKIYHFNLIKDKSDKNEFYGKKQLVAKYSRLQTQLSSPLIAKRVYFLDNGLYIYCTDLYVRKVENNTLVRSAKTFETEPKGIVVNYNGNKKVLFVGEDNKELWQEPNEQIDVPYGKIIFLASNMLFVADGNKLTFGQPFNYSEFTSGYEQSGYFLTDISDGEIVGLLSSQDKLYIFCQHSIICLSHLGDKLDFNAKRLPVEYLNIKEKTFCAIGQEGFFISDNVLYKFFNNKIEKIDNSKLYNLNYSIFLPATNYKHIYILPITTQQGRMAYFYDIDSKQEGFVSYFFYFTNEGYILDGENDMAKYDFEEQVILGQPWASEWKNFDSDKIKNIYQLNIKISGTAQLRLSCDYGDKMFNLQAGTNVIKCNAMSKKIKISLENPTSNFLVEEISVKYRIQGEN